MKLHNLLPAIVLFAIGLSSTAQAVTLYEQPLLEGPGFWAITDTIDGSTGRRAYDNFTLLTTADISSVTWWGSITDTSPPYDNPVAYDIQNWELSIWANNNGQPGQLLYSEYRADAEVTREQIVVVDDPTSGLLPVFRFDLALGASVLLQADTGYWLSILAFSPTGNPWFQWLPAQVEGDDASLSENLGTGQFFSIPDDRAFALDGSVVPLPAAVWLLASALAGISLTQRRQH